MALEIEVHSLPEAILAEDRRDHPDHFRSLLVDGRGIEVADLAELLRPHGMGEGPRVLGELVRFQEPHLRDALDRPRALVGGELVVAIDRQAFFQAELEPVAAGDPVAGPVVEVLVRDDRLDIGVVAVGRRLRVRENVLVVEDVEPLVLHGAHVEVRNRDDHEDVEVVLAPEPLLVPAHGALQRIHRVGRARLLSVLDEDLQRDLPSRGRDETVLDDAEVAGDEREQVARLGVRIVPDRVVAAVVEIAAFLQVAVGQKQRRRVLRRLDARRVDGQHVRPVGEEGDAAEALRLALRRVDARGLVETHQLRVVGGRHFGDDPHGEHRLSRQARKGQRRLAFLVFTGVACDPVHLDALQPDLVTVEHERSVGRSARPPAKSQRGDDFRPLRVKPEDEVDRLEDEVRRAVVGKVEDVAGIGAHGFSCCPGTVGSAFRARPFN